MLKAKMIGPRGPVLRMKAVAVAAVSVVGQWALTGGWGLAVPLVLMSGSAAAGDCTGDPAVCLGRGYDAAGADSNDAIIVNADSDGDGPGLWGVVVGSNYDGYGSNLTGYDPGTSAQLRVENNAVVMNRNTSIANNSTLTVTGSTTLQNSLSVTGAATLQNTLDVTGASYLGRSTIAGDTGTGATILKGGTNSGTLTLQDGNAGASGAQPAGTSITISGSSGGTAATVFQTTTNADTTSVTTQVGTNAVYSAGSTATLQAGPTNAVTVESGNAGANPGVTINGVVGAGNTSNRGVLITGSGQNQTVYSTADRNAGSVPTWADVAIQSKSYGLGDATLGSAILVTDYGVQIISPQPTGSQTIVNNTGNNSSSGAIVNNNGANSGSGSVTNNTGANTGSGSTSNNIGMNSSTTGGTSSTQIGGVSGNGSGSNGFGNNTSTSGGSVTNQIGMNSGNGTVVNDTGGASGSGSVSNNIGMNTSTTGASLVNNVGGITGNGTVTNGFGNASNTSSGSASNTFGQNNGSGTMTNSLGGGTGRSTNNIGTGTGVATNTIGNSTIGSTNTLRAGNTRVYTANGIASTSVSAGGGVGGSVLVPNGTTQGNSAIVLKSASTSHVVVDANGKLSTKSGVVNQSTASMTLTNGLGNTHGFLVNEQQATMSGGSRSSSLTLSDNGATFSNSASGAPIGVHGVADGRAAFDAVNLRQLYGGIAASMATAPAVGDLRPGESGIGAGVGAYGGYGALGISFSHYHRNGALFNVGVAGGAQSGAMTAVRASVGFKF